MSSKIIAGRYELLEKIGDGGMAVVYKAKDRLLNRCVAVKILKPEFTKDAKFIENFRKESHAAASLSHPNIVGVYDVGREGNINYIVMELVEGESLSDLIETQGRLHYSRAIDIARQIAAGLAAAHKHGIIHRDIKPHNILINEDGIAKIADFGIAKAVSVNTITDDSDDTIMGSVHYFSPEQARGGYVDEKSDIYSLGIVMYEMITGNVPFDGENPVTVALMHINDDMVAPSQLVDGIPPVLEKVILKCTAKIQTDRYQSATDVIAALDEMELVNRVVRGDYGAPHAANDELAEEEKRRDKIRKEKERERAAKAKKKKIAIIGGSVAGVLLITIIILFATGVFGGHKVEVPDLKGMTYDEAEDALAEVGLEIKEGDMVYSDEYEVGQIAAQDPKAKTMVKKGTVVTVDISRGATEGSVPRFIGMDVDSAKEMIEKYDFVVGDITEKNSSEPAGTVLEQTPEPGTVAQTGTKIDLVISDGKGAEQVGVPELRGMTQSEASAELESRGLHLGSVNYAASTSYSKDIVMAQQYAANEKVDKGTYVNITISTGSTTTISLDIDYGAAQNEVFYMTVTVSDSNGTRNVISNQECHQSDLGTTISVTGSGQGTIMVTFDGNTVMTKSADFTKGVLQ